MAYNIVCPLVNNLSLLLLSEANFLLEVRDQVRFLRFELEHMKNFLMHADGICVQHNNVVVVDQIRDVACEAEDIVDKYVVDIAKQKRRNKVMKVLCSFEKAMKLHNLGDQIKQLQTISKQINENRDRYRVEQMDVDEDEELQKSRMEVEEDDVVGFVEEAETLVNQLVRGTQELSVISISGMGGLGKTTLARKVYNDHFIKKRFGFRAWVCVSQKFNLKELLQKILKEVKQKTTEEISEMTEKQLKQNLDEELSHHRYLVVLDDIWCSKHWDELKEVFPNVINGSRVFVTTRNKEVACHATGNPQLELRFLNDIESWELFTRKVFRREPCPTDLEPFGRTIVAKCGGLPLAIRLLGGLLQSREKTNNSWERMVKDVKWHLEKETLCLDILGLSYRHLRPDLRPCFLYMGLFPEDWDIPARQLIQLWISEGFIQDNDNMTRKKEDIAEFYLQLLIDRNLIQVEKRRSDGGVKTCCVHDLIHGLCIKLSKDEKFLESHSLVPSEVTKPRRLSIHCSCRDYISNADCSNNYCIRTLLYFNQDNHELFEEDWKSLFKNIKLLRVLDLGDNVVQTIPKAIEELILLKYLRVKAVDIAQLPSFVCALHSLQTLDLRWSPIKYLPKEIWNMQQLRHLYLGGHTSLPKNTSRKRLFNLQTLCCVSLDPTERVDIAKNAPNLRKLGLYGYHCRSSDEENSTFNLPHLECLKFANECTFDVLIRLPPTITKISLKTRYLQPETIEIFRRLSELRILKLDGQSFGDQGLVFGEGWFPKLQLLKIENSSITRWELGPRAAPNLKRIIINNCPRLNTLPRSEVEVVIKRVGP